MISQSWVSVKILLAININLISPVKEHESYGGQGRRNWSVFAFVSSAPLWPLVSQGWAKVSHTSPLQQWFSIILPSINYAAKQNVHSFCSEIWVSRPSFLPCIFLATCASWRHRFDNHPIVWKREMQVQLPIKSSFKPKPNISESLPRQWTA